MTGPLAIRPIDGPLDATVALPGSKSLTNRALVCAALADGTSVLRGALESDDTAAMVDCLNALGASVSIADRGDRIVAGTCGRWPVGSADLFARLSGTTSRFVAALTALGPGPYRVDAAAPMRDRPMAASIDGLRQLGATVREEGRAGHLPFVVEGGPLAGGSVRIAGDASSQSLSGLLLAGPAMAKGLVVELTTELVSRPYADLTIDVMRSFGASVREAGEGRFEVDPGGYRATTYRVEPDATAASYFFAAAAIVGGRVRVEGLGSTSRQHDVGFVDVLERMGAQVVREREAIEVHGTGSLHGVEVDLGSMSDTAQTLAAVAVFADAPTRVTGIGFIRRKETDRIAAVVAELRRLGIDAEEESDGFVVRPGTPRAGLVRTYHDHRMAMSFSLIGLRASGVSIAEPECVDKTFPGFFGALEGLRGGSGAGDGRVPVP